MLKHLFYLWHGEWSCGWEQYEDKPQFLFDQCWYDGMHYVLHLGPLWIECDY